MARTRGDGAETLLKASVRDFWEEASCGEVYGEGESLRERMESQAVTRYELEPYIFSFAQFGSGSGRDVLEVGVGMGADHLEWAKVAPRTLTGVDLTARGAELTRSRLQLYGASSDVLVADAENLPFGDSSFDIVYSWGVLHHTPDTPTAVHEVWRVLRTGGTARVMVYHTYSVVGYLLWLRYALLAGRPKQTLREIYAQHLESPGTKAYTLEEIKDMFSAFSSVTPNTQLSGGDLLEGAAGQRHTGPLLSAAKKLWPRRLIRRLFARHGLFLMIEAVK